jgi:hypothetical protein
MEPAEIVTAEIVEEPAEELWLGMFRAGPAAMAIEIPGRPPGGYPPPPPAAPAGTDAVPPGMPPGAGRAAAAPPWPPAEPPPGPPAPRQPPGHTPLPVTRPAQPAPASGPYPGHPLIDRPFGNRPAAAPAATDQPVRGPASRPPEPASRPPEPAPALATGQPPGPEADVSRTRNGLPKRVPRPRPGGQSAGEQDRVGNDPSGAGSAARPVPAGAAATGTAGSVPDVAGSPGPPGAGAEPLPQPGWESTPAQTMSRLISLRAGVRRGELAQASSASFLWAPAADRKPTAARPTDSSFVDSPAQADSTGGSPADADRPERPRGVDL